MTKRIENLKDVFLERGRELYNASVEEQKELPRMQKQVTNSGLKQIIDLELSTASKQSLKLYDFLSKFDVKPKGEKDECCHSIVKEANKMLAKTTDSYVKDVVILESIQRLNHNNISTLGTLASYAHEIGEGTMAASLHELVDEEKRIDTKLSELAKSKINKKAASVF
ncbi:DUF892 family protein [Gaetbulibacter sp. M240]|uniref:YciE/YciF ferroxidase family protein n=1 Tax=Gaetbulibacter sp. M240 TaxID=3126511 RepID=UPI00374F155B